MLGRAILSQGLTEFISRIVAFISLPLLARYAGADGLGAYSQVTTLTSFIVPFASLGMSGAIIRFYSTSAWNLSLKHEFLRILRTSILISIGPTLIMYLFADFLNEKFLRYPLGPSMFAWGALLILIGTCEQVLLNFCRARLWFYRISIYNLTQNLSLVVGAFSLLPHHYNILNLVQFAIGLKILSLILLTRSIWNQKNEEENSETLNRVSIPEMIKFGIAVSVASLGLWLITFGDRLVIGYYLTASALGVYGTVYALAFIMAGVNGPINQPMYPQIIRAVQEGASAELEAVIKRYHRLQVVLLTAIAVPLLFLCKQILLIVGGVEFSVSQSVISLTVAAIYMDQFNATTHYVLLAHNRQKFIQNAWLIAGLINLLGNIILTPPFGLEGAALVTFISLGGLQFFLAIKTREIVPIEKLYRWKTFILCCLASTLATFFTSMLVSLSELKDCIVFGLVYLSIYLALLFSFRGLNKSDIIQIRKILFVQR